MLSTTMGTIVPPLFGGLLATIEESSARRVGGFQLGRVTGCGTSFIILGNPHAAPKCIIIVICQPISQGPDYR